MKFFKKEENDLFIILGIKKEKLLSLGFSYFYNYLDSISKKFSTVSVSYTGGLVIDYEEISSVAKGASKAGLLSLFLVAIILWTAFKNLRAIIFLIISIVTGLSITLGLTTIIIGKLNLISVAFAVLFIGLSVDYGIKFIQEFWKMKTMLKKQKILFLMCKVFPIPY